MYPGKPTLKKELQKQAIQRIVTNRCVYGHITLKNLLKIIWIENKECKSNTEYVCENIDEI